MNPRKRQRLEEAGWVLPKVSEEKVGSAEEFLELTEEEKVGISKVVESEKFFEKWRVSKVCLEQLSQSKSPQEILEQHRKVYPKITEMAGNYLKDEALLSQVANSNHTERVTICLIRYKNYYGAMEVDVETDTI